MRGWFCVDVLQGAFQNQLIIIRNCKGDCVYSEPLRQAHTSRTVKEPDGVYFVSVIGDSGTISEVIQIINGY